MLPFFNLKIIAFYVGYRNVGFRWPFGVLKLFIFRNKDFLNEADNPQKWDVIRKLT